LSTLFTVSFQSEFRCGRGRNRTPLVAKLDQALLGSIINVYHPAKMNIAMCAIQSWRNHKDRKAEFEQISKCCRLRSISTTESFCDWEVINDAVFKEVIVISRTSMQQTHCDPCPVGRHASGDPFVDPDTLRATVNAKLSKKARCRPVWTASGD
jgi:hypothetical protein